MAQSPGQQEFGAQSNKYFHGWFAVSQLLYEGASWSGNERAMLEDMSVTAAEMLEAGGAQDIETFVQDNPPGLTIHEMGTARMGRDPQTSVLNANNQMHDVQNIFVTDGAAMASSACQNPSLTYMALTARACDYAVERMRRGEL